MTTSRTEATQAGRRRRLLRLMVLGVASLVTVMAVVLVVAAYRNDAAIMANRIAANAEVLSQDWARTTVRFTGQIGRASGRARACVPADSRRGDQLRHRM